MSVCSDITEYKWLTGSEAAAYLAELAASAEPLHARLERLRRGLSPAKAHLILEQVELRQRAAEKFTAAARMFFTRVGLEQATDEWVARYKALRFSERAGASPPAVIVDLCCSIGGDLLGLAAVGTVIGVDASPIAAHFAEANAVEAEHADRATILTDLVEAFDLSAGSAWHIDPDRRPAGRRTTSLHACQPSLDTIDCLLSRMPHAAVKLAPATKVPARWIDACELEWISRDGECRQLVAWHGSLARSFGLRSATILSAASDIAPRSITGRPDWPIPISNGVAAFVFDTDPAVRAAHLQGALAEELHLSALAPGPCYLTGNAPNVDPAVNGFKVEDVQPLRVRALAQYLRGRGIGRLEIKKRGVDVEPEKLRRDLKLRGDHEATLLITPIAGRPAAIVAQRIL